MGTCGHRRYADFWRAACLRRGRGSRRRVAWKKNQRRACKRLRLAPRGREEAEAADNKKHLSACLLEHIFLHTAGTLYVCRVQRLGMLLGCTLSLYHSPHLSALLLHSPLCSLTGHLAGGVWWLSCAGQTRDERGALLIWCWRGAACVKVALSNAGTTASSGVAAFVLMRLIWRDGEHSGWASARQRFRVEGGCVARSWNNIQNILPVTMRKSKRTAWRRKGKKKKEGGMRACSIVEGGAGGKTRKYLSPMVTFSACRRGRHCKLMA